MPLREKNQKKKYGGAKALTALLQKKICLRLSLVNEQSLFLYTFNHVSISNCVYKTAALKKSSKILRNKYFLKFCVFSVLNEEILVEPP